MNILIVEDNRALAGNMLDYLQLAGHQTDYADNGKQCIQLTEQTAFDVIVMDVMMPGMDGFDTCRFLRQQRQCQTPVIFLTAKTELEDKLAGFQAGADDYLTKPFALEELLCRIEALALRGNRSDIGVLNWGPLTLDYDAARVTREGLDIVLNNVQLKILRLLMQKAPAVVSRQQIEQAIWQDDLPDSDALKSHIYQLRRLLDKPFEQALIETVHHQGYRLCQ